jgi:hypothetical protein
MPQSFACVNAQANVYHPQILTYIHAHEHVYHVSVPDICICTCTSISISCTHVTKNESWNLKLSTQLNGGMLEYGSVIILRNVIARMFVQSKKNDEQEIIVI